jgi:hypothetical protein
VLNVQLQLCSADDPATPLVAALIHQLPPAVTADNSLRATFSSYVSPAYVKGSMPAGSTDVLWRYAAAANAGAGAWNYVMDIATNDGDAAVGDSWWAAAIPLDANLSGKTTDLTDDDRTVNIEVGGRWGVAGDIIPIVSVSSRETRLISQVSSSVGQRTGMQADGRLKYCRGGSKGEQSVFSPFSREGEAREGRTVLESRSRLGSFFRMDWMDLWSNGAFNGLHATASRDGAFTGIPARSGIIPARHGANAAA